MKSDTFHSAPKKIKQDMIHAHFLYRLAAYVIDTVIIVLVGVLIIMIFDPTLASDRSGARYVGVIGLLGLFSAAYFAAMHAKYGASLGKMVVGIRVVGDGVNRPNLQQAFVDTQG